MSRLGLAMLVLLLLPAPAPAAGPMRVLTPPANATVTGAGIVHVVVELDAGIAPTRARLALNAVELRPGQPHARADGRTLVHWAVTLTVGPSVLEVRLGDEAVERREVFFHDRILALVDPPAAFARAPFHVTAREAGCRECHPLDAAPADAAPGAPSRSTCFACHRAITERKAVHGPAALWACTKCHEPASAPARYATPQPAMALCFGCHEEQEAWFWKNPYRHGPTATGACPLCHDPHGSDHAFFLKKAAWDLCTTCHAEKGTGRHVVAWGPAGQTHPTRDKPDPVRPDRELSCASCHNPHAAPGAKLWNFGVTRWGDLCKNCHRGIFGS